MAELAKLHINVVDDSAFASGIDTLVPLYVFATEQDKVLDETTGEIATGTVKELANQVSIVTSRKDVIEKFGAPSFQTENGTVLQNSELNEVGLYGLFDAMGSTSLAYALRADIDLKQLQSRETEPTSPVKHGANWVDMMNTNVGLFICVAAEGTASPVASWDKVEQIELYNHEPTDSEGQVGDYALVVVNGSQTIKHKTTTWETINPKYIQSSISYPKGHVVGDYWLKTTAVNNGASYNLKRYNSASGIWSELLLPVSSSYVDIESAFGTTLEQGSICLKYDSNGTAKYYKYSPKESDIIISGTKVSSTLPGGSLIIKLVNKGVTKKMIVSLEDSQTLSVLVSKINAVLKANGVDNVVASEKESALSIVASGISAINLSESNTTTLLSTLGLTSKDYIQATPSWTEITDIYVSMTEPRATATEGTLWFNDDLKIDIMVNDGSMWKGYNSEYETAKIYVTSAEPSTPASNDLWIDSSNPNYPTIRRYSYGAWELLNNADQSTPNGVIFADARYYANGSEPTYSLSDDGCIVSNLLTDSTVDPDCPNPQLYPEGIILFNTRFSTNNVKEYKSNPFEGLTETDGSYTVGGYEGTLGTNKSRWVSASGNAKDGSGLFGKKAQRAMVVKALASAIVSNEDIRTQDYDFFFATCPGYPEVDDELINLNIDKKEMFEIISDTPKTLEPQGKALQEWATNANNATSHGADGRVLRNEYVSRQYPPMGLATNVDGLEVAVPSSIAKMKNLLVLPRGQICAGTQYGQISNLASVGYITKEEEYASVVINDGLGEICATQAINPIMPRRNTGLLLWGERTENPIESSLSDEHAIITLLRLKRQLEVACLPFFFRINSDSIRKDFHNALKSVLDIFIGTNEIYDYAIEVDSVNTSETINRRELHAHIAIEVAKGIEQIYLPIRVVSTGAL